MPMPEPVRDISQPSDSGSGNYDRLEFIRCVGGRQPQTHKFWNFGNDRITPEVHPTSIDDVGAFVGNYFATYYLTDNGIRVPMFERNRLMEVFNGCAFLNF